MGYLSVLEDSQKKDILMDRGFLSTYYFSYNQENSQLFDFFANNYGFPDITILLYASIYERVKRIKNRNDSDYDLKKDRLYRDGYDKFFEGIQRYNIPYLLINTENLSEKETQVLILRLLEMFFHNHESLSYIKNVFSIENLSNMEDLTFEQINNLIDEKTNGNVAKKLKILKRSDINETTNNK